MSDAAYALASPESRPQRVLVVDDEPGERDILNGILRQAGCTVDTAEDHAGALHLAGTQVYDLAFVDLMLGPSSGIDLVPLLLAANPGLTITMVTAFGSIDSAVEAVKAGASGYIQKPIGFADIRALIERTSEEQRLAMRMGAFERMINHGDGVALSTRSAAMESTMLLIRRAARSADVPVLLRGENGTGKGALAEVLHRESERGKAPFVTINCPTLSEELLVSELFGHVKGSFTGAVCDQAGKVEAAEGGTLFLDELGGLSPGIQAKLLRFMQERRYERIGDTVTRTADVRIVTATNHDLEVQVREGSFREDLLYRLNVVEVTLPSLRQRREDIIDLARHFLAMYCRGIGRPPMELSPRAVQQLYDYPWPGNIRELRNEIQRATVLWPSRTIEPAAFSARLNPQVDTRPRLGEEHSLQTIEKEHIRQVLAKCETFEMAARILGLNSTTLWRKRRRMGI